MKLQNVPKKVMGAFLTISMALGGVVTKAWAANVDPNFLNDNKSNTLGAVTETVKGLASEATSIITYAAIFMIVVGVIIAAVQLGSGNAQKKEGAKSRLAMLIIGAILVFAALGIILFAQNLGGKFADALQTAGTTPTPIPPTP